MLSVDAAVARIRAAFAPLPAEQISLENAPGRVAAADVLARFDQPPAAVSAMDGYAVRGVDATAPGARLQVAGSAPAGHPFAGLVQAGQAVRIFTGAVVPDGADAILIQENADVDGDHIVVRAPAAAKHIRAAALDFRSGSVLVPAGRRLTARDVSLLAAGDIAQLGVRRKPRVAFAATGDELSRPGEPRKPGGIVASSGYGLSAMIARWGGEPRDLGILRDRIESIAELPALAGDADLLITLGGASVGEHDLVQVALKPKGFVLDFWKIAMRPGKPLIFGHVGDLPVIGLPGNPVSSFVCSYLFVREAVAAMQGLIEPERPTYARASTALPANDSRQDYLRARLYSMNGDIWAEVLPVQDSSMLSALAAADCLVVRPPHAEAVARGGPIPILPLADV